MSKPPAFRQDKEVPSPTHPLQKTGGAMPWKPKTPCKYPGCRELVQSGGYCDKHRRQTHREYNQHQRDNFSKVFYGSGAWKAASRRQLERAPMCAECAKAGRAKLADIADHIVPVREGGAKFDASNLQSLCWACHNKKHPR